MFWNRTAREARRQKVMDELLELIPEERRARMDRAVAEGDVRGAEVEQALRLVARLEALSVMAIPGTRNEAATTEPAPLIEEAAATQPAATQPEPSAAASQSTSKAPRKLSRRGRRRAAVGVMAGPFVRSASVRKASRAVGGAPRRRRARPAAARSTQAPSMVAVPVEVARQGQTAVAMVSASEAAEEQWPNISWLRP